MKISTVKKCTSCSKWRKPHERHWNRGFPPSLCAAFPPARPSHSCLQTSHSRTVHLRDSMSQRLCFTSTKLSQTCIFTPRFYFSLFTAHWTSHRCDCLCRANLLPGAPTRAKLPVGTGWLPATCAGRWAGPAAGGRAWPAAGSAVPVPGCSPSPLDHLSATLCLCTLLQSASLVITYCLIIVR